MIRTFRTHNIRKQQELTGRYWEFSACSGEYAGEKFNVLTPCCWESHPKFAGYRGEGEYTTTFETGGNIRIEFKGVSHTAEVYLDGKKITEHYNAYTPFDTVCHNLPYGEHTLMVKADNRFSKKSALHIPNDYMSYGGVSRPVVLENISDVYIKNVHVTPYKENDKWRAKIEIYIENIGVAGETENSSSDDIMKSKTEEIDKNKSENINIEINTAGKHIILENIDTLRQNKVTTEIEFESVREWTQETPNLYEIEVKLLRDKNAFDDFIDRFGFREIKIAGKEIHLNGRKIIGNCETR